jgi:hypothetical protein
LEARISEKKFLGAVELLDEALNRIREPDMMEIGALSDLRAYLGSQESVITQRSYSWIIYLTSTHSLWQTFWWKSYTTTYTLSRFTATTDGRHIRRIKKVWESWICHTTL